MRRRWHFAVAVAVFTSLSAVIAVAHAFAATRSVSRVRAAVAQLGPRMPMSDLALSGGARWLRAPSLEDPFAAFADGPAAHDPDPAGAAIPPPGEVYFGEAVSRAKKSAEKGTK